MVHDELLLTPDEELFDMFEKSFYFPHNGGLLDDGFRFTRMLIGYIWLFSFQYKKVINGKSVWICSSRYATGVLLSTGSDPDIGNKHPVKGVGCRSSTASGWCNAGWPDALIFRHEFCAIPGLWPGGCDKIRLARSIAGPLMFYADATHS